MEKYYTYIYYDPTTKLPFYVGKGKDRRAWKHLHRSDISSPVVQKIIEIKVSGKLPLIGFYAGLDEELALFLEKELILKFGRIDNNTGILLNQNGGGQGQSGRKHSLETIEKIKESKRINKYTASEETRKKLSEAASGRKASDKTIEALRKSRLNAVVSEETRKKLSEASKRSAAKRLQTIALKTKQ